MREKNILMPKKYKTGKRTVIVDFSRGSIKMALAETAGEAARFRGITSIVMPREDDKS
ncbi:MAG: hypothetical protein ACI8QZ_003730, partial [Chlamydiales bacterium]